jgi:hypothetical protein
MKPEIKDKKIAEYVEELEAQLTLYTTSPYSKTYITIRKQIDDFNEQLTIRKTQIKAENGEMVDALLGKIDIFGSKDDKEFERAWKYMMDAIDLHKKLDEFRGKMTKEEKETTDRQLKEGSTAEKHILKYTTNT